ncbi:hypothetical protein [Rhizobium sp. RU36D]|uniref:hypothetical protein n=1 Tax=Rhizobium sp. RU36D TaxID=1907415 RepID=UPI0009D83232|nr:hypothetical protein [Rhizobium sp. RU36D]SMD14595.1 hypothetical protein SAMN05880593_12651 [Rhizobium sp. RU36D]
MSRNTNEFCTTTLARVLELLAVPQMLCRRRSCRRMGRCRRYFPSNGEPCCMRNLNAEQRALVEAIHNKTSMIIYFGRAKTELYASEWSDMRDLEDAAVEVARCVCPDWSRKTFNAFLRARAKAPPPEFEGDMVVPPALLRPRP